MLMPYTIVKTSLSDLSSLVPYRSAPSIALIIDKAVPVDKTLVYCNFAYPRRARLDLFREGGPSTEVFSVIRIGQRSETVQIVRPVAACYFDHFDNLSLFAGEEITSRRWDPIGQDEMWRIHEGAKTRLNE